MADEKLGKSKKYPGIYWRMIKRADGRGDERMYYVLYTRGGRGAKQVFEPVGRSSQGMTEKNANTERAARMTGQKQSNTEKREAEKKDRLTGGKPLTVGRLWEIYREANAEKPSLARMDAYNFKNHLAHIAARQIKDLTTADIAALRKKAENASLSPQTVKHVLGLARRMLRHGVKLGICAMPANLVFDMPKDFRPLHGLRHTFASALASSGSVELYTLQKLLTHESPQMPQRYAHLADEALRRAAGAANSLAGAKNNPQK